MNQEFSGGLILGLLIAYGIPFWTFFILAIITAFDDEWLWPIRRLFRAIDRTISDLDDKKGPRP